MSHAFSAMDDGLLCLSYSGAVAYTERRDALREAARRLAEASLVGLLVDFTDAQPYEEDAGARVDFVSSAIVTQWPPEVRIALLNAPHAFAEPTRLACQVRQLQARSFADRHAALAWLAS